MRKANPKHTDEFPNPDPSRQLWLTCENPRGLVQKYCEYAHGDPTKDRRVVLDAKLLPDVENNTRLRVVQRDNLLERFISTVRDQSKLAAAEGEPLLVLIFGHGEERTYGVQLGGTGNPERGPRLKTRDIKQALHPDTRATLLLTSCYSGGWIVQPDLNNKPLLNVTGITASDPEKESLSWPKTNSVGRASGSRVASAILHTLVGVEQSVQLNQGPEIMEHPTYIQLASSIWSTLKAIDPTAEFQQMQFSAQDDRWEMEYRRRSGLPLLAFKERWDGLRRLPYGSISTATQTASLGLQRSQTGDRRYSLKEGLVRDLGWGYLSSFPGWDEKGPNVGLHGRVRRLLADVQEFEEEDIDIMYDQLTYRLDAMREAERIRDSLHLDFPTIFTFDSDRWMLDHFGDKEIRHRYDNITSLLMNGVFDPPVGDAAPTYTKPRNYLAIALHESLLSQEQIAEGINKAVEGK